MKKTYKREVAGVMLGLLGTLYGVHVGTGMAEALAAAESMKYPVFAFAMGAFGLDALAKQINK